MMDERFPIGKFAYKENMTESWIQELEVLPSLLNETVKKLNDMQLDTPYRDGGWTIRQVVHHIADSHLNAYTRFKLALTEENPVIKPYEEAAWAELADYQLPVDVSLKMIKLLHNRLVVLLRSLNEEQLNKTFIHPDSGEVKVKENIGIYAWHGKHHLAHITNLCNKNSW
ncbi:YfiT family bacillithiol transferase [Niallia sp. 03133]|uniref:YfiT family bacillithiol transferase n=1 Tax=Niallia sp. 03133 TaxID=3458060 RepID=UPI004043B913